MHLKSLVVAALACVAPLTAQVNDLGNGCAGTLTPSTLTGSIVTDDVTVTFSSPGSPFTPISLGVFVVGFGNVSAPLPCGCTLVPSFDVVEVGALFTGTNNAQLLINDVPPGITGTPIYFQGVEFFTPGTQTGMGCSFVGLDFSLTNALEVLLP